MNTLAIGDRVSLTKEALSLSYVKGRHWYTDVYEGKTGTIIGYTADCGKLAIQFDEKIFTRPDGQISSHDNGCHGKGERQYSWYFPVCCVTKLKVVNNNKLLLLL